MPKCPNCSQKTLRTEDWACQWCGYPLLSSAYKRIPKTYKLLKEERLHKTEPIPEPKLEPEPESTFESEAEPVLESRREPIPEPERKVEPIPEPKLEPEPVATFESEAEPVLESRREPIPEPEREVEPIPEPKLEPEPESTFESEAEPVLESRREPIPEPEREVEPIPEPKLEPEPVAMKLTVEELLSAYTADGVAANAKFVNKLLRVTGVVAMIDVKDMLGTYYIRLTGAERNLLQSVQCMFGKKHAPVLKQLEKGQTVTVQGEYNGSIMAIRMIDCVLVQ